MLPTRDGSLRLFRLFGIEVFLHWSWFVIAAYSISLRGDQYSSLMWNVLEYVSLFGIVLMHEFGHSLACRQVGGKADQIVLWPLGGVAYVAPPPRPGATFWSIAAGPLVNVMLFPVLSALLFLGGRFSPDVGKFITTIWAINLGLLCFNILPVYPLDGGQMLRSLLWFFMGPARSLLVAATLGVVTVVLLFVLALLLGARVGIWSAVLGAFVLFQCWNGLQHARMLGKLARFPRHGGWICPDCGEPALRGGFWECPACHRGYDRVEQSGQCPVCGVVERRLSCPFCGNAHDLDSWRRLR